MKKLLILLAAFLLLCVPVLAEEDADLLSLAETLLPGHTCVEAFGDGETLALLADNPDGARVFVGGIWQDGVWQLTTSTPLPADTEMYMEDDEYTGCVVLGFYHPTADELPWAEHYVELADGKWQVVLSLKNRGELIRYEPGCITSDMYDDYYGTFTLPLDVAHADWLALPLTFAEAMALMDTTGCEELNAEWSAFEEDYEHIPDAKAASFCAEYLPDYTIYDGRAFDETALLLADDAQGMRYFFGCVKEGDEWNITRSTPLPEGASCETFHAGWNWLRIWLPLPRARQNVRIGADSIRCTVGLIDGSWQVCWINPTLAGVMSFEPHAICEDTGDIYYGDYDLPLDVTIIDWMALPSNYTEALDLLDSTGWAQVMRGGAALRLEASADSTSLGTYTIGAPMRVHQQTGEWAQVSPIGSTLTGWMPLSDLLPGEEQAMWSEEYGSWSSRYIVPLIELDAGEITVPHNAHDKSRAAVYTFSSTAWVDFLGLCADGCCCHVYYGPYGMSGYIPVDTLPLPAQIEAMAFRDLPEYTLYYGDCSETSFAYLMENQNTPSEEGGSLLLYCGAKAPVGWTRTISTPLPAGVWASFSRRDMEAGTFCVNLNMDSTKNYTYTFARQWDNTWAFTGVMGISRDTAADSYTLQGPALYDAEGVRCAEAIALNRSLASLDWLSLPLTFDEALLLALPVPEGCALTEGRQFPDTAMYLMARPDGTTVFAGFERTAEGWRLTESTPLPEGECRLDAYHADVDCITIHFAESSAAVALQPNGQWLVTWANDVSIGDNRLWFGMLGPYYADVLIDRSMTCIDWAALPADYDGWLAQTDASGWAVVTGEGADLRAEDSSIIAAYLPATSVRLLEHRDGLYHVAVNGGNVTGWMEESALLVGAAQLTTDEEGSLAVAEDSFMWGASRLIPNASAMLRNAPDGSPMAEPESNVELLAVWPDGWLHVLDSSGMDGFIRREDCTDFDEWLADLREQYDLP